MQIKNILIKNRLIKNILIFSGSLFLLISCSEEKQAEKKLIRPISYQQVGYLGGQKIRTFSGSSRTDKIVNMSFRSSGVLSKLNIKLGQQVTKGQLLAQLDNVQARLNHENSISSKNSAESKMKTAKLNLNRIRSLYEKGGSSLSDFETAKDAYRNAQQNFDSSIRNVEIQKEQISYGYLYSSADGVIAAVNAELNENISSGFVIATLNSGTKMDISLGVPESVINNISKDMQVEVTFASLSDKMFEGVVSEISPSIDVNTATYPVIVNVSNPSDSIKNGMSANVTFNFAEINTVNKMLVVPAHAVGEDSNGQFVFVVSPMGENGIVNKQKISIGDLTVEGFEILSGLTVGQYIATAGLQTLLDGQEVIFNPENRQ